MGEGLTRLDTGKAPPLDQQPGGIWYTAWLALYGC